MVEGSHAREASVGVFDGSQDGSPTARAAMELANSGCLGEEHGEKYRRLRRKGQSRMIYMSSRLLNRVKEMHREPEAVICQTF